MASSLDAEHREPLAAKGDSAFAGLPVELCSAVDGLHHSRTMLEHPSEIRTTEWKTVAARLPVELCRAAVVARFVCVRDSEIIATVSVSSDARFLIELRGKQFILRDAFAIHVHHREIRAAQRKPAVAGFLIGRRGGSVVTCLVFVHDCDVDTTGALTLITRLLAERFGAVVVQRHSSAVLVS